MRKLLSAVAAITAAVATAGLLAGCSGSGSTESKTLTVWARTDDKGDYLTKSIADFEKESGYTVKMTYIPFADFPQKLASAVSSGTAPDAALVEVGNATYFESVGALEPLDDREKSLSYWDQTAPSMRETTTWAGKNYGVPFNIDVSLMYWNKDLFTKAGLDPDTPPQNWAELEKDAKAVTALGNGVTGFYISGACPGCLAFQTFPMIWASGGNIYTGKDAKAQPTLQDPAVTKTMTMLQDLWKSGTMAAGAQTDNGANYGGGFANGKLGISLIGSFNVSQIKTDAPNLDFGVAGIPGEKGGSTAFVGGDVLTIPKGSKNPGGAWKFIKFMTGDVVGKNMSDANVTPGRLDLIDRYLVPKDSRYSVFIDQIKNGKTPKFLQSNAVYGQALSPYTTITDAIFTGKDIATVQASAQKAAQKIMAQSK